MAHQRFQGVPVNSRDPFCVGSPFSPPVPRPYGVDMEFIPQGEPTQNSYLEQLTLTFRRQVLDFHTSSPLRDVRKIVEN